LSSIVNLARDVLMEQLTAGRIDAAEARAEGGEGERVSSHRRVGMSIVERGKGLKRRLLAPHPDSPLRSDWID
jgi:hypothetical protein